MSNTPLSPILSGKTTDVTPSALLSATASMTPEQKAEFRANVGATDAETSIPDDVKVALLDCFAHVAWVDDQGQTYYDALEAALYPLDHITAVYTQSGTVYDTDSLDSLKADLVVTAVYEGGNTETVPAANYTLSGTLTEGTSTITVSYGGKTATFNVTVTHNSVLYRLQTAFTSNGTNTIDTGVALTDNDVTTVMIDVTVTTFDSTTRSVFSNQLGSETQLNALKTQVQSGATYFWGSGLSWTDSKNIAANGNRIRFVMVFTKGESTFSQKWAIRNVTQNTSRNDTALVQYKYNNSNTIRLGQSSIAGFLGTINSFTLLDYGITDDAIADFLANGDSV